MSAFNKLILILFLSLLISCTNQKPNCKPELDVDIEMEEIPQNVDDVRDSVVPTATISCKY